MISEHDLRQAIAECQGERSPNANTCMKLASYYTIHDHMYGKPDIPGASNAAAPVTAELGEAIAYNTDTAFSRAIYGKDVDSVLSVIDDLMQALQVLSPRLYRLTMAKIEKA